MKFIEFSTQCVVVSQRCNWDLIMSYVLKLWFENCGGAFQLYKSNYSSKNDSIEFTCYRGMGGLNCFKWSSAVKALCSLSLRHKIYSESDSDRACLRGKSQSLASSLDFAISKEPHWLIDMFGTNENGTCSIRSIIERRNPARKRGGAVVIGLRKGKLLSHDVLVFIDDKELKEQEQILRLLEDIESSQKVSQGSRKVEVFHNDPLEKKSSTEVADWVKHIYEKEVISVLNQTDIFSPNGVTTILSRIGANDLWRQLSIKSAEETFRKFNFNLPQRQRLAFAEDVLRARDKLISKGLIRIEACAPCAGALALFYYLKEVHKLNIDVNYKDSTFVRSNEIIKQGEDDGRVPDFCLSGIPSTAKALREKPEKSYMPCLIMPKVNHRLISKREGVTGQKILVFQDKQPGTSAFYLNKLKLNGHISEESEIVYFSELDELTSAFNEEEGDVSAIEWFPHYHFNKSCFYIDSDILADTETLLYCSREWEENQDGLVAFELLVRDAWLRLREDKSMVKLLVDKLVLSQDFLTVVLRSHGFYSLESKRKLREVIGVQVLIENNSTGLT